MFTGVKTFSYLLFSTISQNAPENSNFFSISHQSYKNTRSILPFASSRKITILHADFLI